MGFLKSEQVWYHCVSQAYRVQNLFENISEYDDIILKKAYTAISAYMTLNWKFIVRGKIEA